MLVYRAGVNPEYRTLIRQPNGKMDTLPLSPKTLSYARFSPNGRSLAMSIGATRGSNRYISIYDFDPGALTRFSEEGGAHSPMWSPDGTQLAFSAEGPNSDAEDVFVQSVDRRAAAVSVVRAPYDQHASAWPSDTMLVFSNNSGVTRILGGRISGVSAAIVNPISKSPPRPYLEGPWGEFDVSVSPDGQWAAFTSLESGREEIHVRHFPVASAGGQWKVSNDGGQRARWSGDGRTIYYQSADLSSIHAVRVTPAATFGVGTNETIMLVPQMGTAWDVDRATGRMVVTEPVVAAGARIVVMQHWLDQFRRTLSGTR